MIFVDAAREIRQARLQETRGWSERELERREKAQLPLEHKRQNSDHVVINEGDERDLREQVDAVLARIRSDFNPRP